MNNDTIETALKGIQGELGYLRKGISELSADATEFRAEMDEFRTEMYEFRTDMYEFKTDMCEFKTDINDKLDCLRADMNDKLDCLRTEMHNGFTDLAKAINFSFKLTSKCDERIDNHESRITKLEIRLDQPQ